MSLDELNALFEGWVSHYLPIALEKLMILPSLILENIGTAFAIFSAVFMIHYVYQKAFDLLSSDIYR